jgi:HEPN domain-containing protein
MIESQSYQDWFEKAKNDLRAAKAILGFYEEPPTDTVCYHCHQVAEKGLKAYINFKGEKHVWTHDLVVLLNECIKLDEDFESLRSMIEMLNKYYTETKYPVDVPILFPLEETKKNKDDAEKVLSFVQNKIGQEIDENKIESDSKIEDEKEGNKKY